MPISLFNQSTVSIVYKEHFYPVIMNYDLKFGHDLERIKVNNHVQYLGEIPIRSKVIVQIETDTYPTGCSWRTAKGACNS